jgi:hypothetical protein
MKIDKSKCLLVISIAASLTPTIAFADGLPQCYAPQHKCARPKHHRTISLAPSTTKTVYETVTHTIEKPVYIDRPVVTPAPEPAPVQPVLLEQAPACEQVIEQPMVIENKERWHLLQIKIF